MNKTHTFACDNLDLAPADLGGVMNDKVSRAAGASASAIREGLDPFKLTPAEHTQVLVQIAANLMAIAVFHFPDDQRDAAYAKVKQVVAGKMNSYERHEKRIAGQLDAGPLVSLLEGIFGKGSVIQLD